MSLNEQYLLYTFAEHLVDNHEFKVFYVNEKLNEIWLEKKKHQSSQIVRLIHKGFDWKNHLKQDIAHLFQRIFSVQRLFGRKIEIYNLYFTTYQPVDSWEKLKRPLESQGKPKMKMKVYYFDEDEFKSETKRFEDDLLDMPVNYDLDLANEVKEDRIEQAKENFAGLLHTKKKELANIFNYGKPLFTYILIAINILLFLFVEMNGGSASIETLIQYGAKYNPAIIIDGEWWRIITSMFLHIGMLHLALNMVAIYYLGTAVERMFGNGRFLFIYFIAGIGGSLASFAFSQSVSAGASGAIFGLFGALLYFGIIYKRLFFQTIGTSLLFIIAINLVIGLLIDGIDMAAHLGGLIFGFIAAVIVSLPAKRVLKHQLIAVVIAVLALFSLIFYGIESNTSNQMYLLHKVQIEIGSNDYEQAVNTASEALKMDGDFTSALLFQRAYAYIQLSQYDKAKTDLEKSITYEHPLPESYYNLALLYQMEGEKEQAVHAIEEAYKLNSANDDIIKLYEELTDESGSD